MLRKIGDGILAGIVIAIGCAIFLACENKVVGAVLFSVALLTICYKGYSLFTGKVGFIIESHDKNDFSVLLLGLFGNLIGTVVAGYLLFLTIPSMQIKAESICIAKLDLSWYQTLVRAIFCGILMYIAVSVYRENKSIVGILFAIPVFILSGFEHSIADMGYFAVSGIVSFDAFLFILIVIVGNAIGAMLLPFLAGKWNETKKQ